MLLTASKRCRVTVIATCTFLSFLIVVSIPVGAQTLKGKIIDGSILKPLAGVSIFLDSFSNTVSWADGNYLLRGLKKGAHDIIYSVSGFQTRVIRLNISREEASSVDIILFPLSAGNISNGISADTATKTDAVVSHFLYKEHRSGYYQLFQHWNRYSDIVASGSVQAGTDKDGGQLVKRLNGVVSDNSLYTSNLQALNIFGMGARYNQVFLDGALMPSFDPVNRSFPFAVILSEVIESSNVQRNSNGSLPADFAGGNIEIKTKDIPDKNFLYILAGSGIADQTNGGDFYGAKKSSGGFFGFPGSARDLPSAFPTTRSQFSLSQKNPQEQSYLSRQLKNNLSPSNTGSAKPDDKIVVGFGRIIQLKNEVKIGINAFISHQKYERIDKTGVQAVPNTGSNPYPFANPDLAVIHSNSQDTRYQYSSQVSGVLNASVYFRKNKITFKSFAGSQYTDSYTNRNNLIKPDEDSLAHTGISYLTEAKKFISAQLAGEHALGKDGRLKLKWLASYFYLHQHDPDERNFLLRRDSAGSGGYEIARPSAASLSTASASFTNTRRLWRDYRDHNFTGSVSISVPFRMGKQIQFLEGGIYVHLKDRIFYSDLLLVQGPGYTSLNNILAPERYYPGGLTVNNFYNNLKILPGVNYALDETNRANYSASANIGASFLRFENKLTKLLSLLWGVRFESNSQLVSNTQYNYFEGYRNPQLGTLDENSRVMEFDFLPSVEVNYRLLPSVLAYGSFYATVNRPELQELSQYKYYDAAAFMVRTGNPLLVSSSINNYEAGIKWFAGSQVSISVAAFYKDIDRPIENIVSPYANATGNLVSIPHNTPPARVRGITAAFQVNAGLLTSSPFLSGLSFFGNGNLLQSEVSRGPVKSQSTPSVPAHSLSGSPDYSLNVGLVIQSSRFPNITILYSRTGDYIAMLGSGIPYTLGNGAVIQAIPDYRVKGRNQLDLQLSQKFFKNRIQLVAGVTNILDDAYIEYQDLNGK